MDYPILTQEVIITNIEDVKLFGVEVEEIIIYKVDGKAVSENEYMSYLQERFKL